MVVVRNVVHENAYSDSVALMRVASRLNDMAGVETASLMMGTETNLDVLRTAGLLTEDGERAGPNDLVIAVRSEDAALDEALRVADETLAGPWADSSSADDAKSAAPRRLADAPEGANLAMISTPGRYAAAEALKALRRGMHAFVFSDNVPVAQEVMLKQQAHRDGLLVMGPDCGTAIINGVPLGFANEVRRGDVGLVGASGTGLQQVSTLLDAAGAGVSQVIGVGSHDLSAEVGAISMLDALDALGADPATKVIVLISKPPAPQVADRVLARAAETGKPVVVNFLGSSAQAADPSVRVVPTLRETARTAAELSLGRPPATGQVPDLVARAGDLGERRLLRALYAGGTFAYEATLLLQPVVGEVATSLAGPAAENGTSLPAQHTVLDLGDDEFTSGRPHPMIDPTTRVEVLRTALADPQTAVVILDVVLGYGASDDPAGALAPVVAESTDSPGGPIIIAFAVGTADDPQRLAAQEQVLKDAGAVVVDSSTTAAETAADLLIKMGENR